MVESVHIPEFEIIILWLNKNGQKKKNKNRNYQTIKTRNEQEACNVIMCVSQGRQRQRCHFKTAH